MRPDPWRLTSEVASLLVEKRIQVEHLRALVALARADADRRAGDGTETARAASVVRGLRPSRPLGHADNPEAGQRIVTCATLKGHESREAGPPEPRNAAAD
jgi:hypothetical protein